MLVSYINSHLSFEEIILASLQSNSDELRKIIQINEIEHHFLESKSYSFWKLIIPY